MVERVRSIAIEPLHLVKRWTLPDRAAAGRRATDRWPPGG